jgi:hypothetical protein
MVSRTHSIPSTVTAVIFRGSPRAFRAWPPAWPSPSGPAGSAETPLDFGCQAAPGSFTRCDQAVASS